MRSQIHRVAQLVALGSEFAVAKRRSGTRKRDAQLRVIDRLERLHGLPQKIGQILSLSELRNDAPVYGRLTETKEVLSLPEVKRQITNELGLPWNVCFRSIEGPGIGASLAQVHKAVLHDGRAVAIKVQLPHIAESLELDLKTLGWLTAPVGGLRRGFDLASYRREVGTMLREELDFCHEAAALREFAAFAKRFRSIAVPEVIEECSNETILTMTWVEGETFSAVRKWPAETRKEIGLALLDFFFASIFQAKAFHADPHPGNYRFLRVGEEIAVGLLDFGCTRRLESSTVAALRELIEGTIQGESAGDGRKELNRFVALGFHPGLLEPMQSRLPALCKVLFEPLLVDAEYELSQWRLSERVGQVLGEYRWNFRTAGPASLIYFMRAYQGLIQYLSALAVPIHWRAAFESSLPNSEAVAGTAAFKSRDSSHSQTRVMKIRVVRSGVTKAELTFPAASAENLEELLPEGVGAKLAARRINVTAIGTRAAAHGFPAGELFRLQEGSDDFAVWLE